MKYIVLLITSFILLFSDVDAQKSTRVKGYYRKDGTYVRPHYRSTNRSKSTTRTSNYNSFNTTDNSEIKRVSSSSLTVNNSTLDVEKKRDWLGRKFEIAPSALISSDSSENIVYISVLRYQNEVIDICAIGRNYKGEYELTGAFHKFLKDKISNDHALELISKYGWEINNDFLSKRFYSSSSGKGPSYLTKTLEALRLE